MTLYYGQRPKGAKLDGPERVLDGTIGLIILAVEVLIGLLVLPALDEYAGVADATGSADPGSLILGLLLAFVGSGLAFLITTIVYLARLARARRSWTAPLWGVILVSASCIAGYLVMGT